MLLLIILLLIPHPIFPLVIIIVICLDLDFIKLLLLIPILIVILLLLLIYKWGRVGILLIFQTHSFSLPVRIIRIVLLLLILSVCWSNISHRFLIIWRGLILQRIILVLESGVSLHYIEWIVIIAHWLVFWLILVVLILIPLGIAKWILLNFFVYILGTSQLHWTPCLICIL
jgi:hypothetical protein